jgi:hypothetical protein
MKWSNWNRSFAVDSDRMKVRDRFRLHAWLVIDDRLPNEATLLFGRGGIAVTSKWIGSQIKAERSKRSNRSLVGRLVTQIKTRFDVKSDKSSRKKPREREREREGEINKCRGLRRARTDEILTRISKTGQSRRNPVHTRSGSKQRECFGGEADERKETGSANKRTKSSSIWQMDSASLVRNKNKMQVPLSLEVGVLDKGEWMTFDLGSGSERTGEFS